MRVVNRQEFLSLPVPTVYIRLSNKKNFMEARERMFEVKVQNLFPESLIDWVYFSLIDFDFDYYFENLEAEEDLHQYCYELLENGEDVKLSKEETVRDGRFYEEENFLVFSYEDLKMFKKVFENALDNDYFKEHARHEKLQKELTPNQNNNKVIKI